jgi:hypothetical protein
MGFDKESLMAFWDRLQCYMNVDQPLPDLPIFEQSRHLNPVTDAREEGSGCPTRRWRVTDQKNLAA